MRVAYILMFLELICSSLGAQSEWTFRKEVEGIKAYTMKHDWSKFDEYRIEAEIEGSISSVLAVFRDYDVYPTLFNGFDKIINHVDESDRYINYITVKTPFPAKDRDGVYLNEMEYKSDEKLLHIDVSCTEEFYEPSRKYIQIKNCKGFWEIKEVANNKLEVVNQFVMDPGGNVPAFIINMQTVKNPIKTIKTLRELVLLPQYQNKQFEILQP